MTRRDGKRRTVKSCVLRPFAIDKYGHMSVTFKIQGVQKHRTVHSLVAEAFIGERREKQDVRHLDGNPRNNRVENLRYGTRSENMIDCSKQERQSKQKLNEAKVREIRKLLQSGIPYRRIAKMYGVHPSSIMNIKTRKSYAWIEE